MLGPITGVLASRNYSSSALIPFLVDNARGLTGNRTVSLTVNNAAGLQGPTITTMAIMVNNAAGLQGPAVNTLGIAVDNAPGFIVPIIETIPFIISTTDLVLDLPLSNAVQFNDQRGHTATNFGAIIAVNQAVFTGSAWVEYSPPDWDYGIADFMIEGYITPTSITSSGCLLGQVSNGSDVNTSVGIYQLNDFLSGFIYYGNSSASFSCVSPATLVAGIRSHFIFKRVGLILSLELNGVPGPLVNTGTSRQINLSSLPFALAAREGGTFNLNCSLDSIRVTIGF